MWRSAVLGGKTELVDYVEFVINWLVGWMAWPNLLAAKFGPSGTKCLKRSVFRDIWAFRDLADQSGSALISLAPAGFNWLAAECCSIYRVYMWLSEEY